MRKIPENSIKKGQVLNPTGKNGFSTGWQPYAKRAEHYGNKLKPSEIAIIAADSTKWDDYSWWDLTVLKRMAAMINGSEEERAEVSMFLDRKEGKPTLRHDVRIVRSFNDLTEEELAALAAEAENAQ